MNTPCTKAWAYRGLISECESGKLSSESAKNFLSHLSIEELQQLEHAILRRIRTHTRRMVKSILANISSPPNPSKELDTVLSLVHAQIQSRSDEIENTPVA